MEYFLRSGFRFGHRVLVIFSLIFLGACVGGALESDPIQGGEKICLRFSHLEAYQYYMQEDPISDPYWKTVTIDPRRNDLGFRLRNRNGGTAFYYALAANGTLILKLGPDVNYSHFKDHPEQVQQYLETAGHVINAVDYLVTIYPAPLFSNAIIFRGTLLEAGRVGNNVSPVRWHSADYLRQWPQQGNNTTIVSPPNNPIHFEIVISSRRVNDICRDRRAQCKNSIPPDHPYRREPERECDFIYNSCVQDCQLKE